MTYSLGALQINPLTNEPFLRLRKHPNIIITPPRRTDVPALVPILNDDRVHVWLRASPYPYYEEHAMQYIEITKPGCERGLEELGHAEHAQIKTVLSQSPVRILREVQEDGSDIFLGDIHLHRCDVEPLLEVSRLDKETNLGFPAGHPEIVWTIGYFLAPSHHGRGIMSDAVDTIIHEIGKRYMDVHRIVGATMLDNEGSGKVFLKNGFTLRCQLMNRIEVRETLQSVNVYELHFGAQS